MTRKPNNNPVTPVHLTEEEMLAYLDGELSSAERQRATSHLEACWTCRSAKGELQARIDSFLQVRKEMLPPPDAFQEMRVEQFRQRLARHAEGSETSWWQEHLSGIGNWWRERTSASFAFVARHQRASLAVALSVCLVVVMFTDVLNTRVSADTVLRRAESFESNSAPAADQVTRSSVHVERVDRRSGTTRDLGVLTVFHEPAAQVAYVSMQSAGRTVAREVPGTAAGSEVLNSVLRDEGLDSNVTEYLAGQHWVPDVSPSGFRALIEGRASSASSARREGGDFELHYPFAAGHKSGINEALLRVNSSNYAPESVSLVTDGAQLEYRFTRTAFAVRPRGTELAALDLPAEIAYPTSSRPAPQVPARIVPLSYANSRATDNEVAAAEALHRLESCLGEEVYLFPMSDGSLLVQGLVESPARRAAIREAIQDIPGNVRSEVFLPGEVKSAGKLFSPPDQLPGELAAAGPGSASATVADASGQKIPLYDSLYRHFAAGGADPEAANKQVIVFSNEIVSLARKTFLHAWALKRLDREFADARTAGLSPAALKKIEDMRRSHRQSVATLAQRQQAMLSQFADPGMAAELAGVPQGEDILLLAREQNDLIRSLFVPSNSDGNTKGNLSKLMAVLRHMGS